MRKKKNSKLRSALAIFLAGAMVLGMIPGGMGQVYASDSTPTPAVAFDETSVSDPSTGYLESGCKRFDRKHRTYLDR